MTVDWGGVSGTVVFDSTRCPVIEHAATGFSMLGTRSLLVTDQPAVYVHDTGGLGTSYVTAAAPATEPAVSVALVEHSTRVRVRAQLPGDRSVDCTTTGTVPKETLTALSGLNGRMLPGGEEAEFITGCGVSVVPEEEQAVAPPSELVAYVVVAGGRVQVRTAYEVLVDWPRNRVTATVTGRRSVRLVGGALLGGRLVAGATVHLATGSERAALLAVLGAGTGTAVATGMSAPVTVRGLGSDESQEVDCVLGESVLELQAAGDTTVLASFDLVDPQLRVAGTAGEFVLFHPASGPLSVRSGNEPFGARVQAHPRLQEAARTTLDRGPFPAVEPSGRPVACVATSDALHVMGGDLDVRLPYQAIERVTPQAADIPARLTVTTATGQITLAGQLELVRAIHTALVAGSNATASAAAVPDLLRAATALEEDYLLTTVFGPFCELHAALPGVDRLTAPAVLPDADEQRNRAVTLLHDGLTALVQHLDRVGLMLPAYLRHRDGQLLAPGGAEPDWLKHQEAQLRQALAAPVQRAVAEAGQLLAQAERLQEWDPSAQARPDYSGAAMTLGAAALLNPVLAVAGAAAAYRQHTAAERRHAALDARADAGWQRILARWNTLLSVTVPLLAYQLTEHLFGPRWHAAHQLTVALAGCPEPERPAALRRVATRLARLDVLRRYPSTGATTLTRGEVAAHLRAARDAVSCPFPEL